MPKAPVAMRCHLVFAAEDECARTDNGGLERAASVSILDAPEAPALVDIWAPRDDVSGAVSHLASCSISVAAAGTRYSSGNTVVRYDRARTVVAAAPRK